VTILQAGILFAVYSNQSPISEILRFWSVQKN